MQASHWLGGKEYKSYCEMCFFCEFFFIPAQNVSICIYYDNIFEDNISLQKKYEFWPKALENWE